YDVNNIVCNLIYHEKRHFIRPTRYYYFKIAGNAAYKQIKTYDKSVQFPQHCTNPFRFEVKSKESKFINKLGVYSLEDFYKVTVTTQLGISLLKEWDSVLLLDRSKNIDEKYFNTCFWEDALMANNRNRFNNLKKQYFNKLGSNNLHSYIKQILFDK